MKITKEQKENGIEIGQKLGQSKMYINEKGEYFTNENFAKNSVGSDKEKFGTIEVTAEVVTEEKTTELGTAIESATELESVQAILDAEKAGKSRKSVLEAGAKKIETFNASK